MRNAEIEPDWVKKRSHVIVAVFTLSFKGADCIVSAMVSF